MIVNFGPMKNLTRRLLFLFLVGACSIGAVNLAQAQGIPPFLLTSSPTKGATGVSVNSTISFTFLSAMGPGYAIAWSSNLDPSKFTYSWSADNKTLTCTYTTSLPANATITWQLNPPGTTTGFADPSGTPLTELIPGMNSGQFTTGSGGGTTNPCTQTNQFASGCTVIKSVSYAQTSAAAPVIDPERGALISATVSPSSTIPVSSAALKLPNGSSQSLSNFFGSQYFLPVLTPFATQAALDAAYPNGTYSMAITRTGGAPLAPTLQLPANGYPPVPQIINFPQTQAIDPSVDFVLQFNGLGVPAASESISFTITSDSGLVFQDPDPCIPRTLANTATSLTIPAKTLSAAQTYDASLTYFNITTEDTNSFPVFSVLGAFSVNTSFKISTVGAGTSATPPKFTAFQRMADGSFQMQLTGQTGVNYQVQYTSDWKTWTPLNQQIQTGASVTFTDSTNAGTQVRFYRAQVLP
jgi:hypothetical protein